MVIFWLHVISLFPSRDTKKIQTEKVKFDSWNLIYIAGGKNHSTFHFPFNKAWTIIVKGHKQRNDELFSMVKHKKRRCRANVSFSNLRFIHNNLFSFFEFSKLLSTITSNNILQHNSEPALHPHKPTSKYQVFATSYLILPYPEFPISSSSLTHV